MAPAETAAEDSLRYPIGRYRAPESITSGNRIAWIEEIEALPRNLRRAVAGLNEEQLETRYRPGGWTVRQLVHHIADSHLNSYSRFRWAVTEESAAIKTYDEAAWAELADAKTAPIELSLALLEPLHARWALLLRSFSDAEFKRAMRHPEWGDVPVEWLLGQYAWHSRHHVAHINRLRERQGWDTG
ncbi:MAG: bacillithiol transferase BstA [Acidobacteriaceae bacterium]|nr:bacillithiol transferase BstA [Acidobacteriaceae bacterium]